MTQNSICLYCSIKGLPEDHAICTLNLVSKVFSKVGNRWTCHRWDRIGSVQPVTILLYHKDLLSSLPALLSDYHVMKAELDPPQYTKDWDTETPQVPWSLTPDSAAVSCLITSTSRLCWRYFSWPSGRCHASNKVLFIDTKPESHYICIWLLHFILFLTSM